MSAPIIAYRTKSLFVDSKEHLIAKLQVDYATMKSRFHLDELLTVQIDENTNGVIGCVTIGGANEAMHNITTRGGVGRIGNMRMLNDAGLNTYATSYSDPFQVLRVDTTSFSFDVISSYYSNTVRARLYYKYGVDWLLHYDTNSINVPKNSTDTFTSINPFNGLKAGDFAEFKVVVTNEEGDKEVLLDSRIVQPTEPSISRYNTMWPSYAYNNTNGTTTKEIQIGEWPFTIGTEILFTTAPTPLEDFSGYYIANDGSVDKWLKVEKSGSKYYITSLGLCQMGAYPFGDPGNSYPMPFTITGVKYSRAADYNDLHASCVLGDTGSSILYRDEATYFENWNPTTNEFTNRYEGYFLDNNGCVQYEFTNGFSPDAPMPPTP